MSFLTSDRWLGGSELGEVDVVDSVCDKTAVGAVVGALPDALSRDKGCNDSDCVEIACAGCVEVEVANVERPAGSETTDIRLTTGFAIVGCAGRGDCILRRFGDLPEIVCSLSSCSLDSWEGDVLDISILSCVGSFAAVACEWIGDAVISPAAVYIAVAGIAEDGVEVGTPAPVPVTL
jgi:hypothetical protein